MFLPFSCFIDGEISSHSFLIFIWNSFFLNEKKVNILGVAVLLQEKLCITHSMVIIILQA